MSPLNLFNRILSGNLSKNAKFGENFIVNGSAAFDGAVETTSAAGADCKGLQYQ
jgi:hypothetical protein